MQPFRDITFFCVLYLLVVGSMSDQRLPILITRRELATISGKITIKFKNIPKVAFTYWTHGENWNGIGSGSVAGKDNVEIEMIPLPYESKELYVTLTTKYKKWCATSLIVKLIDDLQPGKIFESSEIEDIEVDWRGSCDQPAISKKTCQFGSTFRISCPGQNSTNIKIHWSQRNSLGAKADFIGPVYFNTAMLYMMADDFDDGTTAVCCSNMSLYYTYEIEFCKTESYTVTGGPLYSPKKKFYNESTEFPNWCDFNQSPLVFTQDKIIKNVDNITSPMKYTFTKKDNGSILYCLYFSENTAKTFTRLIDKKFMIIYNENKDQHPTAPVTPPPQTTPKPTRPLPVQLYAGTDITYSCIGNNYYSDSQIRWNQLFRINGQKIAYPYLNGTKYNLQLSTVEEFDNNSTLTCFEKKSRYSYQIKYITLIPPSSSISTTSNIPIIPYNEETEVEYNCNSTIKSLYIILINGNKIVKVLPKETKQTFSQSDNSSILACLVFTLIRKESKVIRNVQGKSMLVYIKSEKADVNGSDSLSLSPASKPDMEGSVTVQKYHYYIGGALVLALMLMLIILWNFKKSRSRRQRPSPEAKEDRNANTGQVTYAELNLRPTSQEFRRPIGVESPYAELANLDQETYENLRITEACQCSAVEESPYVEITQSTQADLKRSCKNSETTESPYAEVRMH